MVSSAFFQRKAEDESEIWTLLDTCTMKQCEFKHQNVYPCAMMNLTILFLMRKYAGYFMSISLTMSYLRNISNTPENC